MSAPSPELRILLHLASRPPASAAEIATAQARTLLVVLETMRLVSGRQDLDSRAPRRVFHVTHEGKRKAGISDTRSKERAA